MSITILEVAGAAGVHPDTASAALADVVEYDFRGLAVVDDATARDYVAGARAAARRHEAEQQAYRDYLTDRGTRRRDAVRSAAAAAADRVIRGRRLHSFSGPSGPSGPTLPGLIPSDVQHAAQEAADAAGRAARDDFDRREPEQDFSAWIKRHGNAIAQALAA